MDPGKIFQVITNSTLLATRLLSGAGSGPLEFSEPHYCAVMEEDARLGSTVVTVSATHKHGQAVRYSITGGNKDGLFTIDQHTGVITLAAALDYEVHRRHELVVGAEGLGGVGTAAAAAAAGVRVRVADVNDNAPRFLRPDPQYTVIEEDDRQLPATLTTVEARDEDWQDQGNLLYTLHGDGVDGYSPAEAFFTINPSTGELVQQRALDRDPPRGREVWRVRVQVRDGQAHWSSRDGPLLLPHRRAPRDIHGAAAAGGEHDADEDRRTKGNVLQGRVDSTQATVGGNTDGGGDRRGDQVVEEEEEENVGRHRSSGRYRNVQRFESHRHIRAAEKVRVSRGKITEQQSPRKNAVLYRRLSKAEDLEQNTVSREPRLAQEGGMAGLESLTAGMLNRPLVGEEVRASSTTEPNLGGDGTGDTRRQTPIVGRDVGRGTRRQRRSAPTFPGEARVNSLQGVKDRREEVGAGSHDDGHNESRRGGKPPAEVAVNDRPASSRSSDGDVEAGEHLLNRTDGRWGDGAPQTRGEHRPTDPPEWAQKHSRLCRKYSTDGRLSEGRRESSTSSLFPSRQSERLDDPRYKNPLVASKDAGDLSDQSRDIRHSKSRPVTAAGRSQRQSHVSSFDPGSHVMTSPRGISKPRKTSPARSVSLKDDGGNTKALDRLTPRSRNVKAATVGGRDGDTRRTENTFLNPVLNSLGFESQTDPAPSRLSQPGRYYLVSPHRPGHGSRPQDKLPSTASDNLPPETRTTLNPLDLHRTTLSSRTAEESHDPPRTGDQPDDELPRALGTQPDHSRGHQETPAALSWPVPGTQALKDKAEIKSPFSPAEKSAHRLHGGRPRRTRSAPYAPRDHTRLDDPGGDAGDGGRGCEEVINEPGGGGQGGNTTVGAGGRWGAGDWLARGRVGRVHVVETVVTITVKDINDNPPVFPNTTMFGEVQENGPIDLSVGVISAWDADDASEGTNARLTYSIEKNVIHDRTGEAIFTVDPQSGLIRTALCCLDRETTPEYHIQVVASDGGGLKGTGTVVVRLADVNDNSPRLARQLWELEVDETWGEGPPDNSTILEISAVDRDTSNYFFYRVVEASGWGWQHFRMRSVGAAGQLYATRTLDFENETHRRGFKFMVQVTDRGRGGWTDPRHLATAWVSVRLRDVNDNPPQFRRPHAHLTVREDAAPGTLLAALPAHDPDMGGAQEVEYRVTGGWGALTVDAGGGVSLWRGLDREAPDGAVGVARVIGVDHGAPPLTATATLTITVTDVNDCAPRLLPPTLLHVAEGGAAPTLLGLLTATDRDVWALGHGPPFTLALAPTNPAHVLAHISLSFDPHLDSGRGGAELWAVGALDREEQRQLTVGVVVADARGLAATETLTVVVDDLNDNPMGPAAKTVYLWKTQGGGSDAPLGRVYVDDPDDWDLGDKTFRWRGAPHPLFSLHPDDGTIYASSQVRQGRYELQFSVSDRTWDQRGVVANVTVMVRLLPPDALAHATPITLTPTTPLDLTRGWTPKGGGGLGRLLEAVGRVLGDGDHTVEVVSVSDHQHPQHSSVPSPDATQGPTSPVTPVDLTSVPGDLLDAPSRPPSASVWVSVTEASTGRFMDPVKLQGLLNLHTRQLEETTRLTVVTENVPTATATTATASGEGHDTQVPRPYSHPVLNPRGAQGPSSAATSASTALPLQVVDTNVTSLVTPRLSRTHACHAREPESCTPASCLNGGRCLRSSQGNRCVCPQGSTGPRCKVLGRTFLGEGWAWVRPLPPCLPATISFRLLTRRPHALLLYSGPLAPQPRQPHAPPRPMLAVQLHHGRPQVLLEGEGGPLKAEVNATVHDGDWHTIHLHFNAQGVSLMLDLCGRGWDSRPPDDSHCLARASWTAPAGAEAWVGGASPLQVGGLAHAPPRPEDHGWREAPTPAPLDGCLARLALNGQLVDLGEPAYSRGSAAGCRPQEAACPGGCGRQGRCVGGLEHPECECDPGWAATGSSTRTCDTPTVPAALGKSSYVKVALSFTPAPRVVRVQLRVRTRGPRHGLLLHLAGHHRASALTIHLRGGMACASMSGSRRAPTRGVCVEGRPLGDGDWHTVRAERHGHNLVVSVDDGDDWRRNESLVSLLRPSGDDASPPAPLDVVKQDAVTVGGMPEFAGLSLIAVHDDLRNSCVDDLRVSGRSLPLPPAVNGTNWGQVTTSEGVTRGCQAADACVNITCAPPLSCTSTWGQASCSCGPGRQLVSHTCEDINECLWRPCLHGGSCHNLRPGYLCVCGPGHTGDHCQWATLSPDGHPLTTPAAAAALALSLLLLVVLGVVFSVRLHRQWLSRTLAGRQVTGVGGEKTIVTVKDGAVDEGGGRQEQRQQQVQRESDSITFLQCFKYNLRYAHPPTCGKDEEDSPQQDSGLTSQMEEAPVADQPAGEPLLPRDDLRAYAYEGEGSSAGSLTSAISGLRAEVDEEGGGIRPLVTEFLEVMDLLRHLPEATKTSPSLLGKVDEEVVGVVRACNTRRGPDQPPSPATPPSIVALNLPTPGVKTGVASPVASKKSRHSFPKTSLAPS